MSSTAKATLFLMIATIISKILGFVRELVLASSYGASVYSDAYIVSMNIPLVICSTIGLTIGSIFIPLYIEIISKHGNEHALKFTSNMINIVGIISMLLVILGFIFIEPLVKIFAMGFNGEALSTTINFSKILLLTIIFTSLGNIITAYLQSHNNFIIPGIMSIPKNIIIIVSITLSVKYGPYLMIWGTLLGSVVELLFQIPASIKKGYKYKLYLYLQDEYIKKAMYLIGPILIGVAVNQVNVMVDRTLASTLTSGSISALNYANKLNGFVMAMFISSIGTVIYTMLSKQSLQEDKEEFIKSIVQSINSVILIVIPISVGAIVLATPIVRLLFERGEFDARATSMTAIALIMYSIGMVAFGLREILGKVFYSIQDTKTPMINGIIAVVMNILLNIMLIKKLNLAGLALATSLSAIICIFLLFNSLKKKIGYYGQDKILKTTIKSIISAIIMGIATYYVYNIFSLMMRSGLIYDTISLFGSVLFGVIVYGILTMILKVDEINIVIKMIGKKLNI